ncbi:hypothetical protein SADUNF_Sadunf13G0089900 [Salix dunnii]|uniref:Uncharacterized protein n=1 Tax=Salix dunnii TaxID=1413687 RepID=A0A835MM27_9ROSI|nr:hypothetical protein SADUNF_Sadunf13G0089900 [Salix dunnii]
MIRGIRLSRPVLIVYCHAAALGYRLPSIASAKDGVASAIALWQPSLAAPRQHAGDLIRIFTNLFNVGFDEASTRCCPSFRQNMLISKSDVVFAGHQ